MWFNYSWTINLASFQMEQADQTASQNPPARAFRLLMPRGPRYQPFQFHGHFTNQKILERIKIEVANEEDINLMLMIQ